MKINGYQLMVQAFKFGFVIRRILYRLVLPVMFITCPLSSLWAQESARFYFLGFLSEMKGSSAILPLKEMIENTAGNTKKDVALAMLQQTLCEGIALRDNDRVAYSLLALSKVYSREKQYDTSRYYAAMAARFCFNPLSKDKYLIPAYYHRWGVLHYLGGDSDSMTYCFFKALNTFQQYKVADSSLLLEIYSKISCVFTDEAFINNPNSALEYLNKAQNLAISLKDSFNLAIIHVRKGYMYGLVDSVPQAMEQLGKALQFYKEHGIGEYAQTTYSEMGRIFMKLKQNRLALVYYDSAKAIYPEGFATNQSLQHAYGICYEHLGQYEKAIAYCQMAIATCRKSGIIGPLASIFGNLANIYRKAGNGILAYDMLNEYVSFNDSLISIEKIQAANKMATLYSSAEKDKSLLQQQLLLQKQERNIRTKNFWLGGILVGSSLLMSLFISIYLNKRNKLMVQIEKMQNQEQRQEIEHLNARMLGEESERNRIARELHDGVSVLLSAARFKYSSLGKEFDLLENAESYKEVLDILEQAGQEVRAISYNLIPEILIHKSLPAAVKAFCALMEKSNEQTFQVQFYGQVPELPSTFSYAVYRMVQELVQNIMKHALATAISLQLVFQETYLFITVEDNGIGFEEGNMPPGMGLLNLKKRVTQLDGNFSLSSKPGVCTLVEIELPLEKIGEVNPARR